MNPELTEPYTDHSRRMPFSSGFHDAPVMRCGHVADSTLYDYFMEDGFSDADSRYQANEDEPMCVKCYRKAVQTGNSANSSFVVNKSATFATSKLLEVFRSGAQGSD